MTFIERMTAHWTTKLGLAPSAALIRGWLQLEQATTQIRSGPKPWQVVQLPTGTGKTEALKVLCSIQDPVSHPGILIVTKFKTEADVIAQDINALAGWPMARSAHSGTPAADTDVRFIPVLVTTHEAYRLALRGSGKDGNGVRHQKLTGYGGGQRGWVFIDEAFDWTDSYSVNLSNLRAMMGDLSGTVSEEMHEAVERLLALSVSLTDPEISGRSDRVLTPQEMERLGEKLHELWDEIDYIPDDALADWVRAEPDETVAGPPATTKHHYWLLLQQLQTIAEIGCAWVSRRGGQSLLHSSRSLLERSGDSRGIILDATAASDPTYSITSEQITVLPRPEGIRLYHNVTLHVSYGHRVGKQYLEQNAAKDWPAIWGDVQQRLKGKRVLVCAHKAVIQTIARYGLPSGQVEYVNWGKIDGRNDWGTCDTVLIFGLPYLDDIAPTQTFFAHAGMQTDDWFAGDRPHGDAEDIRTTLRDGFVAKSVIQAINRVHCRKAIDREGNCLPTEVYILLPNGKTGEATMQAIEKQMPGIRVASWHAGGAKRKARSATARQRIMTYFDHTESGLYPKSDVVRSIGTNHRSFERIAGELRQQGSELTEKLRSMGVHYYSSAGRGKEAYFTKQ